MGDAKLQRSMNINNRKKALEITKEHEYKQQEIKALIGLGDAYRENNQFQTAIGHYEKALEITKEHEYKQQEIKALLGLGHAYRENKQFQTAIGHYEKALEITKEQALLGLGDAYTNISNGNWTL